MISKQVYLFGKTASGLHVQSLFGDSEGLVKTAGVAPLSVWENGDVLKSYIEDHISSEDRKDYQYLLVNALGAGEYFGSNINADYFPWDALTHEGPEWGYQTFLNANVFMHHKNQDPERGFGKPVLSMLNHRMKRVELLLKIDRQKAALEGAGDLIASIDAGQYVDVSMGCKVPYDVCSVCGNKSKTKNDYCVHMSPPEHLRDVFGRNKLLPSGKRVFVYNFHPRFFDLSLVFIGADRTAKSIARLVASRNRVCMGPVCVTSGEPADPVPQNVGAKRPTFPKTASLAERVEDEGGSVKLASFLRKTSSQKKISEILKTVPADFSGTLESLERSEPTIPPRVLNHLAEHHDLGSVCSSTGALGIVLKPAEFQRIVLVRSGREDLADALDRDGATFRHVPGVVRSIPYDPRRLLNEDIVRLLSTLIASRSTFSAPLRARVLKIRNEKNLLPTARTIEDSVLDKVSSAYNGYRANLMLKLSDATEAVNRQPVLREAVLGDSLSGLLVKTAEKNTIDPDAFTYIAGVHLQDRSLLYSNSLSESIASNNRMLFEEH